MSRPLRKSGRWTFYGVQGFNGSEWRDLGDRYVPLGDPRQRWSEDALERRRLGLDFTPSGDCWQATGLRGTFDLHVAISWANYLREWTTWPDTPKDFTRFRVVKVTVLQEVEVMEQMSVRWGPEEKEDD